MDRIHDCGGTILSGSDHDTCDRCGAFAYHGGAVPSGTDRDANTEAWDTGNDASPAAALPPVTHIETVWRGHDGRQLIVVVTLGDDLRIERSVGVPDALIDTSDTLRGSTVGLVQQWWSAPVCDVRRSWNDEALETHIESSVEAHWKADDGPDGATVNYGGQWT